MHNNVSTNQEKSSEPELRNILFWQEDGCPAHCTGKSGPIYYPFKFPDITASDSFLWDA